MRALLLASLAVAAGCLAPGAPAGTAWSRSFSTGRHVTAPAAAGAGDVVIGVTTRGVGVVVDEGGAGGGVVAGDARAATCVVTRFDVDGALLWQVPVRAGSGGQTRCVDVAAGAGGVVVRGETFDVDDDSVTVDSGGAGRVLSDREGFVVSIDEDGIVRSVDGAGDVSAREPRELDGDGRAIAGRVGLVTSSLRAVGAGELVVELASD